MKSDACREKRTRAPIPNCKPLNAMEVLRLYDAVFLELEDAKEEIARLDTASLTRVVTMLERKQ
jgi:hypothetical protein